MLGGTQSHVSSQNVTWNHDVSWHYGVTEVRDVVLGKVRMSASHVASREIVTSRDLITSPSHVALDVTWRYYVTSLYAVAWRYGFTSLYDAGWCHDATALHDSFSWRFSHGMRLFKQTCKINKIVFVFIPADIPNTIGRPLEQSKSINHQGMVLTAAILGTLTSIHVISTFYTSVSWF